MEFWNRRYSEQEYAYGKQPNVYFKSKIQALEKGKILFVAEGEGRNAVYAAELGWDVTAFDLSQTGKEKADLLAKEGKVSINYLVVSMENLSLEEEAFDAIVLIFAHFSEENRAVYHKKLSRLLKPGGILILEGFSKNHIERQRENPAVGGPKEISMLYDIQELKSDFSDFVFKEAYLTETELDEGIYHKGWASTVRLFGTKQVIT